MKKSTYLESLNSALHDMMEDDKTVYLIGEDIRDPYGGAFKVTKGLSRRYPDRVINTPISEAGITGVATGMAIRGLRPVMEIMFGDFISLAADQILSNISKLRWVYNDRIKIPLVIRTPMGGRRGYGPTHSQSIEKMFLGMPGLTIVAPSFFHDAGSLLKTSIRDENPILFIEHKMDYSRILRCDLDGKAEPWFARCSKDRYPTIRLSPTDFEDDDVTIITYGGMAPLVEEAMKLLLLKKDIAAELIIPSMIKPVSVEAFLPSVKKTGKVVIVEEATLTNGWGAEVAALLSDVAFKYLRSPIKRVAAKDLPIANTRTLEDHILPGVGDIINTAEGIL